MSKLEHDMSAIYKTVSSDDIMLRLLYYKPQNGLDDPLSPSKTNVLDLPNSYEIIDDVIKFAPKVDDLTSKNICRLLFYPGRRSPTKNHQTSSQEFVFDLLVHIDDFQLKDLRMEKIVDRLGEIMFGKRIMGLGKVESNGGNPLGAPPNYIGYQIVYTVGSGN